MIFLETLKGFESDDIKVREIAKTLNIPEVVAYDGSIVFVIFTLDEAKKFIEEVNNLGIDLVQR